MSPKASSMSAKTSSTRTNEPEGVVHERQGGGYEGQERVDQHQGLVHERQDRVHSRHGRVDERQGRVHERQGRVDGSGLNKETEKFDIPPLSVHIPLRSD